MAFGGRYDSIPGLVATGDLSAAQYKIVKFASTAGAVKVAATAATDKICGILQNDPTNGQAADVAVNGIVKALAENSVAAGDSLTVSSTGRCKSTTVDGNRIVGIALAASTAAGDIIPVAVGIHDRYVA